MLDNASRVDSTYTYMLLQAREIALTNPTRHALSYTVRLEGDGDSFVLDASVIKIEPGTSVQVCAVCDGQICCGTLVDHTFQGCQETLSAAETWCAQLLEKTCECPWTCAQLHRIQCPTSCLFCSVPPHI